MDLIKATNSKISDLRQEMQEITNRQRPGYNALIDLIAVVKEYHQLSAKDREERNQQHERIYTKPFTNYKKDFEK
jgi:hypothetical protein